MFLVACVQLWVPILDPDSCAVRSSKPIFGASHVRQLDILPRWVSGCLGSNPLESRFPCAKPTHAFGARPHGGGAQGQGSAEEGQARPGTRRVVG